MPFCEVETDLPASQIPAEFQMKLMKLLAELLKKPVEYVVVSVKSDVAMKRGLKGLPVLVMKIYNVGSFTEETSLPLKKPLFDLLQAELPAMPEDRVFIFLHALEPHQVLYK